MLLKSLFAAAAAMLFAGAAAAQDDPPAPKPSLAATPELTPENTLHLDLSTGGRVTIQLRPDAAPNHVERIKTLTRRGFYDGVIFHRVIEGFMAQTGDPTGTGEGGSELPDLKAEFNALPHVRGAVSAARTNEPDTANSQFFIMLVPRLTIDYEYSVFGRVVDGMQYVDAIARGEPPLEPSRIVRASIGADNVPPMTAAELQAAAQAMAAAAAAAPSPTLAPAVPAAAGAPAAGDAPAAAEPSAAEALAAADAAVAADAEADEAEAEAAVEAETTEQPESADSPEA